MIKIGQYISIDPDIRFGKPCIIGTRITISDILKWLSAGMTFSDILEDYPSLKEEHLKTTLAFAANRENISNIQLQN